MYLIRIIPAEGSVDSTQSSPSSAGAEEGFSLRAVIFANGLLDEQTRILSLLQKDDVLIAADGGAKHMLAAGIQPHVVIGDMDSLDSLARENLREANVDFLEYPRDKDQTDLELALAKAIQMGISEILLFGLLGGRLDQTLANLLILTRKEWEGVRLILKDGADTAYLMRNRDEIFLDGEPGDIVSLIPLTERVSEVTTQGLRWPLQERDLELGTTLSVSNEMVSQQAIIKICNGKLILVHRENREEPLNKET
jgi:thiamine pyrophosphokinase